MILGKHQLAPFPHSEDIDAIRAWIQELISSGELTDNDINVNSHLLIPEKYAAFALLKWPFLVIVHNDSDALAKGDE